MFKRLSFVLLPALLAMGVPALAQDASPAPEPTGAEPVPVIFDTDSVPDDWMSFLYLSKVPDFDIKAITVTGASFEECDAGVSAMLSLVDVTEYGDVPVSCWAGRLRPTRLTMEQVGTMGLPEAGQPADVDALELFTSTVRSSESPVTVLSLGGFTNIAAAFLAEPELVNNIERIYVMGGAVDVPGNQGWSTPNETAESNIAGDPTAARIVFESGVPITLVGLDATNDAPVTMDVIDRLRVTKATPQAEVVYRLLEADAAGIEGGWLYFWDQLATAVMTDPGLVTLTDRDIAVIDEPGPERGRTKPVDAGEGSVIQVASDPDVEAFLQKFLDTINQ